MSELETVKEPIEEGCYKCCQFHAMWLRSLINRLSVLRDSVVSIDETFQEVKSILEKEKKKEVMKY